MVLISSLYGGRIAEEVIYGREKMTTGASNDIERATDIARKMVTQWGMSEQMGPMLYAEDEGEVFLGRSVAKSKHMSDDTARAIDAEIKHVINRNYDRAKHILMENMDILHAMKDALMKYETIDAKQIDVLMARIPVRAPVEHESNDKPDSPSTSSGTGELSSDVSAQRDDVQENRQDELGDTPGSTH